MSSNTNIGNTPVNQGYVQLIHTGETGGIDGTLRTLYDGDGTASDLQIASNKVKVSTELYIGSKTATEFIQDIVGDMFTTGSYTNITTTYDDTNGNIDLNATGAVSGITGGTGIDATGSGNITIAIDSTVTTLTGTQTLTNKTLASPTFTGDILFNDASTPVFTVKDTTNNVQADWRATDTLSAIGTTTDSPFYLKQNGNFHVTINSNQIILNTQGEDRNTIIKDDSGTAVFKVDAGTSETIIGTLSVTGNATVTGDLQVNGTTTTVNQTNLDVSDNIIGLNRGASSNANDSGLIIERGSTGDNVFIGWDESLDRIRFATTTADASSTGNLSLTNANIHAGRLYADVTGDLTGDVTGNVTGNLTGNVTGSASLNLLISSNLSDLANVATARTNLGLGTLATLSSVDFDRIDGSAYIASNESFIDSDLYLMTAAAIDDLIISKGYGFGDGDMTGVSITASNPLDISQSNTTSGNYTATISLDATEFQSYLTDMTDLNVGADELLVIDIADSTLKRKAISEIRLSLFDDTGFSTGISFNGSTANGLLTYGNTTTADVEANLTFDGTNLDLPDSKKIRLGTSQDLEIYHDGSNNYIDSTTSDQDLYIRVNDGGVTTTALRIDASDAGTLLPNNNIRMGDSKKIRLGASNDFNLYHDGSNSYIYNETGGGKIIIQNTTSDGDIEIKVSDGGSTTNAIIIDASDNSRVKLPNDNQRLSIGASNDIQITHDGTNSYIDNYTGNLNIKNNEADKDLILLCDDGSGGETAYITLDGSTTNLLLSPPGNVGIGTTSPATLLHINKSQFNPTSTSALPIGRFSGSYGGGLGFFDTKEAGMYAIDNGDTFNFYVGRTINTDTPASKIVMTMKSSGNVGIGETSIDAKLHLTTASSGLVNQKFESSGSSAWRIGVPAGQTYFAFDDSSDDLSSPEVVFTTAGNVGIGTQSPSTKMHIKDASNNVDLRIETDKVNGNAQVQYLNDAKQYNVGVNNTDSWSVYDATVGATRFSINSSGHIELPNDNQYLKFGVGGDGVIYSLNDDFYISNFTAGQDTIFQNLNSASSAYVTNLFIDGSAERVGIGTSSPSSKLHVSGGDSRHSGGKLIYEAGGVSDYFRIQRSSSSGRSQIQFATETTSEVWRVGMTGGGGEDFVFWDGGANVLILDRSNNQAQFNNDVIAYYSSDKRLKENVKNIESPLEKLNKINGVEFDWIKKEGVHGNEGHDIGVIAQEIEEVLPEVVTTRDNGYKAVKYEKIVPLLIEAIKEQQKQIEELKNG